jgi:hypothetical protein
VSENGIRFVWKICIVRERAAEGAGEQGDGERAEARELDGGGGREARDENVEELVEGGGVLGGEDASSGEEAVAVVVHEETLPGSESGPWAVEWADFDESGHGISGADFRTATGALCQRGRVSG